MDDEQWQQAVAEHLKAIRGSVAVIAFVVVAGFLVALLMVLAQIADSGSI